MAMAGLDIKISIHSIQIMNQNDTALSPLLESIDFSKALTNSLAELQRTLQKKGISATSQVGLQAYQQICQEYINLAQRRPPPHTTQRLPSKQISVSELLKIDPNAFANKEQALVKVVKRHHLRRLLRLAKVDQESVRREDRRARQMLRMETAKFHFRMQVASKFMTALRALQGEGREKEAKAKGFLESRQEAILEEYFLAWKDEALMSEAERTFRDEMDNKYEILAKVLFLRRFRLVRQATSCQKKLYQRQTEQLSSFIQISRIKVFFSSLKNKLNGKDRLQILQKQLNITRKRQTFTNFLRTFKKIIMYRALSDTKRENFVYKTLYPKLLLRRMRRSLQLRKVYFKNGKKLLFLAILLEQIKECLLRKGYEYEWMKDLSQNVGFTDSKVGHPYRKHCLSRVFTKFREQLQIQRNNMEEIKQAKGGQILKQLIYNYKLSIFKQKEQHSIESLQVFLAGNMAVRAIAALKQCHFQKKKQESLIEYLALSKAKEGIHYLKMFYRSSKFYGCRLEAFQQSQEKNQLQIIFHALKTVLLTERVNSRLVEQYQSYTNRIKIEKIFQCLKDYCFTEQLVKKRQRNVTRIRLSRYADQFFYNLKVDLYAQTKGRLNGIHNNITKVCSLRIANAFERMINRFKRKRMGLKMSQQIDKEYQLRFKWKMFNLLKVITQRRHEQQEKANFISGKQGRRLKGLVLDRMLTKFLLSLLLKKINSGLQKKLLKSAWKTLKRGQFQLKSIREQSKNEEFASTSPRMTSQFKLASPSFDLSSEMEQEQDM